MKRVTFIRYRQKLLIIFSFLFSQSLLGASLTLATYNLRNFGTASSPSPGRNPVHTNTHAFVRALKSTDFEVMAVQEVIKASLLRSVLRKQFPHLNLVLSKCGGRGEQKLGFIYDPRRLSLLSFKEDFSVKERKNCHTGLRPLVVATFKDKKNYETFRLIGVHLKAGSSPKDVTTRAKQMYKIQTLLTRLKNSNGPQFPTITLGDFNTTDFKTDPYMNRGFSNLVRRSETTDVTRSLKCTSYWWGGEDDGWEYPSHLDHILIDSQWLSEWSHHKVKVGAHCARTYCRETSYQRMGESYWGVSDHCPTSVTLVE